MIPSGDLFGSWEGGGGVRTSPAYRPVDNFLTILKIYLDKSAQRPALRRQGQTRQLLKLIKI